ncbi:MAG: 4Fe-4S dicluster domain-containing protein, partial [Candidatus Thermoplasmatota archaeon]|nr:4Fe-4S dicluster domain-containing protein [Candidatus Thermoplasmatota archaeon]
AEALGIISNKKLFRSPAVAVVDEIICRGCGKCIEICEYKALELKETPEKRLVAQVNPAVCEGCGACSAACCNGAITVKHFANNQIIATIEGIMWSS